MKNSNQNNSEFKKVQEIINAEIRPALQMHGGDVEATSLEGNVLKINYHGACGCCPGATTATLAMITQVLQERFREDIEVKLA
ncbi:nitrogen-fixing NifU domain protein [sediment metagenome]|uniref:Nitrogen-fixing NifU domain protein n=1 Tax=sediment metagenome TaxID=749907 RepID=D9PH88_9ZZZZ